MSRPDEWAQGVLASTGYILFHIHIIPTLDANGTPDQTQLMQFSVVAPRVSSNHLGLLFAGMLDIIYTRSA